LYKQERMSPTRKDPEFILPENVLTKSSISFFREDVKFYIYKRKNLEKWISGIIKAENLKTGEINIILCSDAYLLDINRNYLKHNYLTDIITFQNDNGLHISGDVYISTERCAANAVEFKRKLQDEFRRLIAHGILHLCGWKDKLKFQKEEMTRKENQYLDLWKAKYFCK
jgi:probable rRNA maturation factor